MGRELEVVMNVEGGAECVRSRWPASAEANTSSISAALQQWVSPY